MRRRLALLVTVLAVGCRGESVGGESSDAAAAGAADTAGADDAADATSLPDTGTEAGTNDAVEATTTDAADVGTLSDGATVVDSGPCGVHPGPFMVQLKTSKGTYCIDTREVSNAQYAEFSASTSKPAHPAYCKFKTGTSVENPLPAARDLPVTKVDWCDAYQYCAWAGKRLCGGMAGGHVIRTGTLVSEFVADSQWTLACQNNVPTTYSTGETFPGGDAGACNITKNGGKVWDVSAGTACKGVVAPFDAIVNLTGNAGEWEDNCANYDDVLDAKASAAVICYVRGGLPSACCVNDFDYKCTNANIITARDALLDKVGFRCCSK